MSNILGNMPPVFGSGYRGVVPAPTAADVSAQNILRADGTWGAQATSGPLPSQTGNAGELLTTDGTNASWTPSLNDFSISNLTFGVGGPNARSSIAARAARQGLVFDGTAGAPCTLGSAIGTSDATIAAFIDVPSSNPSAIRTIAYIATGAAWKPNDCVFYIETNGTLNFQLRGTLVGDTRIATVTENLVSSYGGKRVLVTATRVGTTLTIFINGVSAAFTVAGSAITWANSIDGTILRVGDLSGNSLPFVGFIAPYIENRALTAAEVVSLYEAGVPSGSDYNNASNTLLNTSTALNTFSTSFTTFTGASATGFTGSDTTASKTIRVQFPLSGTLVSGRRYRIKGTATLTAMGTVQLYQSDAAYTGLGSIGSLAAGAFEFTFTAVSAVSSIMLICPTDGTAGTHTLVISGFAVDTPGLLLAPDAAQAGGGLTWYDTSGNAANITLPASGVTWNVPSSGNVTSGGALNLRAGGTNQNITFTPSGTGVHFFNGFNATAGTPGTYTVRLGNGSNDYVGLSFDGTYGYLQTWGGRPLYLNSQGNNIVTGSGNVLVGGTIDGGQKLQVAGTGIVKGSFFSARSDNTGSIQLIPTSGVSAGSDIESFNGSSSLYARLNMRTETFQIFTGSSGNTLCATFSGFDNSATLQGNLLVNGSKIEMTANGAYAQLAGTGTGAKFFRTQNTGGDVYVGVESATAGSFFPGSAAYNSVWYSPNNDSFFKTPNATFTGTVTATQHKTASGTNSSVATGTPSTLFSLSGKSGQMFLVHACLVGINDANSYAAYATVVMDGTAARIVSNNGTLMTITLSGTNVQATQTSGVTQQIAWKYTSL